MEIRDDTQQNAESAIRVSLLTDEQLKCLNKAKSKNKELNRLSAAKVRSRCSKSGV